MVYDIKKKLNELLIFCCIQKGDITECTDGDSRLIDGTIEQEGRPEVCVNGVWSSICGYSWNVVDAYVFCVTLGYSRDSTSKSNNHYDLSLL